VVVAVSWNKSPLCNDDCKHAESIGDTRVLSVYEFYWVFVHMCDDAAALQKHHAALESAKTAATPKNSNNMALGDEKYHHNTNTNTKTSSNSKQSPSPPPLSRPASGLEDVVCSICCDQDLEIMLSCTHSFCMECISDWQMKKGTCPICRARTNMADPDAWVLCGNPSQAETMQIMRDLAMRPHDYCQDKPNFRAPGQQQQ
jgi:Ring finger domain